MENILSESLYEYNSSIRREEKEVNESLSTSSAALFRELFLRSMYVLIHARRKNEVKSILGWAKKLKSLGYPDSSEIKKALGPDNWKRFEDGLVPFMQKQVPSFSITSGDSGAAGGNIGKDDSERLALIAKVTKMTTQEIKDLISK